MADHMDYRLALVSSESRQVLGIRGCDTNELPRISIPRWERPAEQLTTLIKENWQAKTVVLDILSEATSSTPCAIVELRSPVLELERYGLVPVQLASISDASLGEKECRTLNSVLAGDSAGTDLFARIGWIEEVQQWIRDEVRSRTISFSDDIRQFNAGGGFSLVRLGTQQGPAYWLKAVGAPNEREFRITVTLAGLFPDYLPTMVAARPEWTAWVMEDAGQPLSNLVGLPSTEKAVTCLAKLQRKSIDHIDALLTAGCTDCSVAVLAEHLPMLGDYLEDAMSRQTSTKVPRLEVHRLRELVQIIRDACSAMQDLRVPNTLIHNDMNRGNILAHSSRCVFTDWAEACIGNPFLTFQHLCVQVSRDSDQADVWLACMKSAYKKSWREWLTETQIERAFALMPILAIVSYLCGLRDWLDDPRRESQHSQAYSRSLARYMDRTARAPELLEALCR
jgi:hypothetical protein